MMFVRFSALRRTAAAVLLAGVAAACSQAAPPAPARGAGTAQAVFAGGCFWCTEADFDKIPGVLSTTSGYAGGKLRNPTYEQVSAGGTGHIEAVRVIYDPRRVSYATLAARFIRTVDPLDDGGSSATAAMSIARPFSSTNAAQRRIAETIKARTRPR